MEFADVAGPQVECDDVAAEDDPFPALVEVGTEDDFVEDDVVLVAPPCADEVDEPWLGLVVDEPLLEDDVTEHEPAATALTASTSSV